PSRTPTISMKLRRLHLAVHAVLIGAGLFLCRAIAIGAMPEPATRAEQWGIFELALTGPTDGNPFDEVELSARFTREDLTLNVRGFYDGEGVYRIRFMPESAGEWRYVTTSNRPALDGKAGTFIATAPAAGNHGPVRVRNT